jgi:protein TonB
VSIDSSADPAAAPPVAAHFPAGLPPARLPPAGDRILTTCFLAALLHGIVILGVTFSVSDKNAAGGSPGLEVLLVNDAAPMSKENPNARYLAERTQRGTGNTLDQVRALIPRSSPAPAEGAGVNGGDGFAQPPAAAEPAAEPALSSPHAAPRVLYFAPPAATPSDAAPSTHAGLPLLLEERPDVPISPNDEGVELRLRGEGKAELWVAADTRASDVAVYIDAWRRKVERVGTVNFPDAARRRNLSGTPVVEVTISADGKLAEALVRRSSGQPEIDAAALRILHLAAPFDPFPPALGATHDQIRIAYEWQFLDGALQGSSVHHE